MGIDSPSPVQSFKDIRRRLAPLEKVQEEVLPSNESRDDNPETCPEPPNELNDRDDLQNQIRVGKKSNSDVESQLEAAGIKIHDSELAQLASVISMPDSTKHKNLQRQTTGNVTKKAPTLLIDRNIDASSSNQSSKKSEKEKMNIAQENQPNEITPQPP